MSYNPTNWVNGETPINDSNLNHIEQGIKDVADLSDAQESKIADIANNQIPEEYLQSSVDNYIANNQAGIATKTDVNNLDSKLSSEIANVNKDLKSGNVGNSTIEPKKTTFFENENPNILVLSDDNLIIASGFMGTSYEGEKVTVTCASQYICAWGFDTVIGKRYVVSLSDIENVATPLTNVRVYTDAELKNNIANKNNVTSDITIIFDAQTERSYIRIQDPNGNNSYRLKVYEGENANDVWKLKEEYYNVGSNLNRKTLITYGDSVTAGGLWQDLVRDNLGLANVLNSGIGGTTIANGGEDNYFCSDSRLSTLPTNYNMIFVMGGTNDMGKNIPIGDTVYNGGFDETTFKGAIASLIVKLQNLMPNTEIIFGTPLSGRGLVVGENATTNRKNALDLSTEDYAKAMIEVCHEFSIPCIDVFGETGINQFNRATYIADTVHPNAEGGKRIAKVVSNGLKRFLA